MKKFFALCSALILTAALFVSCSKKEAAAIDDHGCYMDIYEAIVDAKKENKNILVIITTEGEDYSSEAFIDQVVDTEKFDAEIESKFIVCHMDFSEDTYNRTVALETFTEEEKKAADRYAEMFQSNYQYASMLRCEYTPSLFLLTKEGYGVSPVDYEDEAFQIDSLVELIASYDAQMEEANKMVAAATDKKAAPLDQVRAIDALYKYIRDEYEPFLAELGIKIPELDKNNETGLCSPYIIMAAEDEIVGFVYNSDFTSIVQKYMELAQNPYLTEEDRMNCYFDAAYFLSISGAASDQEVLYYLQQGLAINPESPAAERIIEAIDVFSNPQAFE